MRIRKGDTVYIKAGKDRGKTGKVLRVNVKNKNILIEGLNTYKKHIRPKRQGEKGETVTLSRPIHESIVLLYCSKCGRGRRIGFRIDKNSKERYCKKCESTL